MTSDQRDIRRKLRVLKHAEANGSVVKTCRYFGIGRAPFHNALAQVLADLNRHDEAIDAAQVAASTDAKNARFHHHVGRLLTKIGRLIPAAVVFKRYVPMFSFQLR